MCLGVVWGVAYVMDCYLHVCALVCHARPWLLCLPMMKRFANFRVGDVKLATINLFRELCEFSQTRSRQQVEHLTQQLVDSARYWH